MKKNTKIMLGIVALVVVVAVMLGVYAAVLPQATQGTKDLTITVVHGDGSQKSFDIRTDARFLAEALVENEIVEDNQAEWGLYILTADGETADEANQEWWCLTKGGQEHMYGASETAIADGESYELTFTVGYE